MIRPCACPPALSSLLVDPGLFYSELAQIGESALPVIKLLAILDTSAVRPLPTTCPAGNRPVQKGEDSDRGIGEGDALPTLGRPGSPAEPILMSDRHDEHPCVTAAATDFLEVGTLEQVPPGAALHVVVGESDLALVNIDGHVVAIGDLCLRCGSPLSSAAVTGTQLICCKCGWQYDIEQGCVVGLPGLAIEKHEVHIDDGHLFVAVGMTNPRALTS